MFKFNKRSFQKLRNKLFEIVFWFKYAFCKNAFVFGSPFHSNAGDQAQTYCIKKWLEKNYPHYAIRIFDTETISKNNYFILKKIYKYIRKKDLVFLHSGYHTTDLYMYEESMQRKVLQLFTNNKVIILPQTIYYQNTKEEKISENIYNSHPDVLLLCRDDVSYKIAERIFVNCKRLLFPDIVTTMIGKFKFNYGRKGILLCVRNDKEALLDRKKKEQLINKLNQIDVVNITDTTLPIDGKDFCQNRESILMNEWQKYSKYKVVVTDRYHGTIFSLVAGTPVIVMPSTDHKLESGVRWFPDSFKEYVEYVQNFDEIPNAVKAIMGKNYSYQLPQYFESEYYDKLKTIIDD